MEGLSESRQNRGTLCEDNCFWRGSSRREGRLGSCGMGKAGGERVFFKMEEVIVLLYANEENLA